MANIFFSEPLDRLAPLFKEWMKEAVRELIPAFIEAHNQPQPIEESQEYIPPIDASKRLGISLPTLRKRTREGIYIAYRVSQRKIVYKRSEIEKALQARRIDHLIKRGKS